LILLIVCSISLYLPCAITTSSHKADLFASGDSGMLFTFLIYSKKLSKFIILVTVIRKGIYKADTFA
jgi:hypothetical protein